MVVPTVIVKVRIESDAALDVKLVAEGIDHVQGTRLVVWSEIAEVVPGVVMQERAVGMGALALHVTQKIATELARRGRANHGRICCCTTMKERQLTLQRTNRVAAFHGAFGKRMLETKKPCA